MSIMLKNPSHTPNSCTLCSHPALLYDGRCVPCMLIIFLFPFCVDVPTFSGDSDHDVPTKHVNRPPPCPVSTYFEVRDLVYDVIGRRFVIYFSCFWPHSNLLSDFNQLFFSRNLVWAFVFFFNKK